MSPQPTVPSIDNERFGTLLMFAVFVIADISAFYSGASGIGIVLGLILIAVALSQISLPALAPVSKTAAPVAPKGLKVSEDFAEKITSPRAVIIGVAVLLLVCTVFGMLA